MPARNPCNAASPTSYVQGRRFWACRVRLALAITRYESGGRCAMHGRAGERGAMQVLPQTARSVGVTGNLEDCAAGMEAGLRYLRLALSMHAKAGWCAVASAYNSGTFRESRCTPYGRTI